MIVPLSRTSSTDSVGTNMDCQSIEKSLSIWCKTINADLSSASQSKYAVYAQDECSADKGRRRILVANSFS
jgi:hypothetical protein